MRPASVGFQCPDCVKEGARSTRPRFTAYGGREMATPWVTYGVAAIILVVFALTTLSGTDFLSGRRTSALFDRLALTPTVHQEGNGQLAGGVAQGGYYRLLTSMFLHFGIVHLILNLGALYLTGPRLEQLLGRARFGALYLLSGLGGAAASYTLGDRYELAAGASGAIFGLFGALFVVQRKRGEDTSSIVVLLVLNVAFGFTSGVVDLWAHLGGLAAGAAVAYALVKPAPGPRRTPWQLAGCVTVAVVVALTVAARTAALTA